METSGIVLMTSTFIAFGTVTSIYTCYGLMYLKAWLLDEKHSPDIEEIWISKVTGYFLDTDPWFDAFIFGCLLWVALIVLSILVLTPALKFVILAIFITAGLHALRWGIRAGKSISKIKSMVHKHNKEE